MVSFKNDYSEGVLPVIMEALLKTNLEQTVGYGEDEYTAKGIEAIKKAINFEDCYVRLLVGGTQTNLLTISHILRPYEAVIAADTGHISVHEAGAIEATGHKVIELATNGDGKISLDMIKKVYDVHKNDFHMVKPKMVYISNATEMGNTYTKKELEAISEVCKKHNLYLYLDGARMASAIASERGDISYEDYAKYCDLFYIGGTKCGLLFGEALVIVNDKIKKEMEYTVKQKGALFAKGRLLGIQFLELFKEDLYDQIGRYSNAMAKKISSTLVKVGFNLLIDGGTNQVFVKMNDEQIGKLEKFVNFSTFPPENMNDKEKIVRFVTSWSTKEEDVDKFIKIVEEIF